MLHIKCRKCGFRLPFSKKINGYTARKRLIEDTLLCPNCGEILIKREKTKRKGL